MKILFSALCFFGGFAITSVVAGMFPHPPILVMLIFFALPFAMAFCGWRSMPDI